MPSCLLPLNSSPSACLAILRHRCLSAPPKSRIVPLQRRAREPSCFGSALFDPPPCAREIRQLGNPWLLARFPRCLVRQRTWL
ncbi:uncharacterized protein BDZ99DRAFT_22903 [Mytilinidion resinicola]|uniref:Uncharacterized protein n=1 Tax=Mytilinidion resinicola TaxID=574789 RepID=A0A6A6Z9J3_9PEZI|nr:uncharacterized protein BDZ99DRAFT_22903 [Mytilinidion resinicola]KAF2817700.1 hypothetical protein BDZ99DRAFT_22903 [Mytilinidion resinicola]